VDAKYFREKAKFCLRLADGLALNNPGRFQIDGLGRRFFKKGERIGGAKKVKEETIRHEAA
jgi:hypothetical protein